MRLGGLGQGGLTWPAAALHVLMLNILAGAAVTRYTKIVHSSKAVLCCTAYKMSKSTQWVD